MDNYKFNSKNPDKRKKSPTEKALDAVSELRQMNTDENPSDTMGSYTGTAYDGSEPEQDADDL